MAISRLFRIFRFPNKHNIKKFKTAKNIPALVDTLRNRWLKANLRQAAAEALGEIGTPECVKPLLLAIRSEDAALANTAYKSVIMTGNCAVPALIEIIANKDVGLMKSAHAVLEDMLKRDCMGALLKALIIEKGERLNVIIDLLLNLRKNTIRTLTDLFNEQDETSISRGTYIFDRLGLKGGYEPLIEQLEDDDEQVRAAAALAIGKIGYGRAIETLLEALEDKSKEVRSSAAIALGDLKDGRSVEPLLDALEDPCQEVRFSAARALGEIKDERAVRLLIEASMKATGEIRLLLVNALGNIGHPLAVARLIEMIHEEYALWRMEYPHDIGSLEPLREPESIEIIIEALKKAGTQQALDAIRNYQKK